MTKKVQYEEKQYGKSELCLRDATMKMRQLKRVGYIARVVYGNDGEFIVQWHKKSKKVRRRILP